MAGGPDDCPLARAGALARGLAALRARGLLCDVALAAGGERRLAHQAVLAAVSAPLRQYLASGESQPSELKLPEGERPGAVRALLDQAYGAEVSSARVPGTDALARSLALPAPGSECVRALAAGLCELRSTGALCDLFLVVGAARFPAHQAVLAAASVPLRRYVLRGLSKLLGHRRAPGSKDLHVASEPLELELQGVTCGEAVTAVLRYVYAASDGAALPGTVSAIGDVLRLATAFELPRLRERAMQWLSQGATAVDACARLSVCEEFGLEATGCRIKEQVAKQEALALKRGSWICGQCGEQCKAREVHECSTCLPAAADADPAEPQAAEEQPRRRGRPKRPRPRAAEPPQEAEGARPPPAPAAAPSAAEGAGAAEEAAPRWPKRLRPHSCVFEPRAGEPAGGGGGGGSSSSRAPAAPAPRLGPGLKTFVINLARRPDRRAHVDALCKDLGLDYELVEAVDGRALAARKGSSLEVVQATKSKKSKKAEEEASGKQRRPMGFSGLCTRLFRARWLTEDGMPCSQLLRMAEHRLCATELTGYGHELWGAVGCSLSHQIVLRRLTADPSLEWALVLEDDASLADVSAADARETFDREMRMIVERYPDWALVYLGGSLKTMVKEPERESWRISSSLLEARGVYQTHAFVIRRTVVSEVLCKLESGFAADAALVSWSNTAPSGSCFLFHPQQLLQQPGGADRWKDSDIFVQGEFFKQRVDELGGSGYSFNADRRRGSKLMPSKPSRLPTSTTSAGAEPTAAGVTLAGAKAEAGVAGAAAATASSGSSATGGADGVRTPNGGGAGGGTDAAAAEGESAGEGQPRRAKGEGHGERGRPPQDRRGQLLKLSVRELREKAWLHGVAPMKMYACLEKEDVVQAILEAMSERCSDRTMPRAAPADPRQKNSDIDERAKLANVLDRTVDLAADL